MTGHGRKLLDWLRMTGNDWKYLECLKLIEGIVGDSLVYF